MRKAVLYCLVLIGLCFTASAQKTIQRGLKPLKEVHKETATDSIAGTPADSLLRFSGYEKTLRASRETLFVTNLSARTSAAIAFNIAYLDAQGRLLHRRRIRQQVAVPPGETRRMDFPSWDTQKSAYYMHGPRPRVSAIPFSVNISNPLIIFQKDETADD